MLLLLRLWDSGTREMDNERSTQGTSAPLLPLLQRLQSIYSTKDEPVPQEEGEVRPPPPAGSLEYPCSDWLCSLTKGLRGVTCRGVLE